MTRASHRENFDQYIKKPWRKSEQPTIFQTGLFKILTCLIKVIGLFPIACASPMLALITEENGFFTPCGKRELVDNWLELNYNWKDGWIIVSNPSNPSSPHQTWTLNIHVYCQSDIGYWRILHINIFARRKFFSFYRFNLFFQLDRSDGKRTSHCIAHNLHKGDRGSNWQK